MQKRCLLIVLLISVTAAMTPFSAWGAADDKKTERVDDLVVTATKSEQSKDEIPSVVDVISSIDLSLTNERDLTGLLKKNSSVDVIEYPGSLSGISIRGFRPEFSGITKHTLILVNGKPCGATNLATLLKDNVERIEVLKGPSSSLYGAESMGGVVNIITKKSMGELKTSVSAGYGSFGRYYTNYASGGKITKKVDVDVNVTKEGRGNFHQGSEDVEKAVIDQNNLNSDRRRNTETDERNIDLRIGSPLTDKLRVDLSISNYYGYIETPGSIYKLPPRPSNKEIENERYELTTEYGTEKNDITASIYNATEDSFYLSFNDSGSPYKSSLSRTTWEGYQLTDSWHYMIHDVTVGFDYQEINVESQRWYESGAAKSPSRPNNSRENVGFYVDDFMKLRDETLVVNMGVRFDTFKLQLESTPNYDTPYSTEIQNFEIVNPRLGFKYFLFFEKKIQLHSTIGTAFVPPDAYEMAGFSLSQTGTLTWGNKDLEPETSLTWDAGVTFKNDAAGYFLDVTYFETQVDDKIVEYATDAEEAPDVEFREEDEDIEIKSWRSYRNSSEAKIKGLEWNVSYDFGVLLDTDFSFELYCGGTQLIESEEYNEDQWLDIQNVSDVKYNMGISYERNTTFARFTMRHIGEMKDTDWDDINGNGVTKGDIIAYGNFDIFDISAGMTFLSDHTIIINFDNIFDTYYYEKGGYPLDGRTFYVQYTHDF